MSNSKRSKSLPKKQEKAVKKLIRKELVSSIETKYHQLPIDPVADIPSSGYFVSLSDLPQGVGDGQRVGNSVMPTSLYYCFAINKADTTNLVRIIILRWNEDTTPSVPNEILDITVGSIPQVMNPYSSTVRDTYNILMDKTIKLDGNEESYKLIKGQLRLARRRITYNNATASSPVGGIYAFMISDSAGASHPSVLGITRLAYKDA